MTALLAGVFNATEELAKLVDEHQFKQLFIKGEAYNLFYQNINSKFLLVVIFKEETLLGSVRVLSQKLVDKLKKELEQKKQTRNSILANIDGETLMKNLFKK
ncbi:MAG: roadblock/LC7 domain-containing protein [candidate division WOR-3 bacterium]